jgi:hypothetical protein
MTRYRFRISNEKEPDAGIVVLLTTVDIQYSISTGPSLFLGLAMEAHSFFLQDSTALLPPYDDAHSMPLTCRFEQKLVPKVQR